MKLLPDPPSNYRQRRLQQTAKLAGPCLPRQDCRAHLATGPSRVLKRATPEPSWVHRTLPPWTQPREKMKKSAMSCYKMYYFKINHKRWPHKCRKADFSNTLRQASVLSRGLERLAEVLTCTIIHSWAWRVDSLLSRNPWSHSILLISFLLSFIVLTDFFYRSIDMYSL